ncbi:hypothetical protein ACQEU8_13990 [Streptomyces sp. CA-250714]|uniref:hypothetical protein n=1 Tax=Streptomyces sp. CA-250714 TaxID=3240060 RepID=UPI003D8CFCC4
MSTDKGPYFKEDLRLLPWASDTGKPCYLAPGAEDGMISALADATEDRQVRDAARVLGECEAVLAQPAAGALALRLALTAAVRALGDVLRVAHSRGLRLGACDDE